MSRRAREREGRRLAKADPGYTEVHSINPATGRRSVTLKCSLKDDAAFDRMLKRLSEITNETDEV